MSLAQQLRDSLKKEVLSNEELYSIICKVVAVKDDVCTCEPVNGDPELFGVRLLAGSTNKGFYVKPAINSIVLVNFLDVDNAYVSMFSEIESINIRGDEFGGLVVSDKLVEQLDIVTSRIDTLYDAIDNGVTGSQDGGAALLASMKAVTATQTKTEDYSDIQNENVNHG